MATRRQFQRLAAATTLGALTGTAAASRVAQADPGTAARGTDHRPSTTGTALGAARAELVVTESATEIVVDNGPLHVTVSKSSPARLTGLRLEGQDLLGSGGRGNYDMSSALDGDALPLPEAANSCTVRRGEDFVDIVFRFSPTASGPFWLERHHIVRVSEPGLHLATVFQHARDLHGFRCDQHRYVLYLDPALFTDVSLEDDPMGTPWRPAATRMPTPAELAAATEVMDATYDLDGLGSAYPRRYYTKYDWATWVKDHEVHGLHGNGYGVFAVLANREAFSGGPVRQDLTLHQTVERPVLLVEPHATHFGSPPVRVAAGQEWAKTYGPYYVHCCRGDDPMRMRAEAAAYPTLAAHAAFYDRVGLPGWVPAIERSAVAGQMRRTATAGEVPTAAGAVAVLGDNRVDFQSTVLGHAYWTDVPESGAVELSNVRPGTYRLTVYQPGVWGEYTMDDVVVQPGRATGLGELTWQPESAGRTVWQLGTPDRTSLEFRRGADFRQWGTWRYFAEDFPDGVTYTVGDSGPDDWNYLQFQRIGGVTQRPWRIVFDLDRLAYPGAKATLTLALAAWSLDTAVKVPQQSATLTVRVNGTAYPWSFDPDQARGATYRSGCAGRTFRRRFPFDAALLRPTGNEISFVINEGGAEGLVNTVAYDAIRLEIGD